MAAASPADAMLDQAEEQLRLGLLEQAQQAAHTALLHSTDAAALGRGYSVIIQADFQLNRLTNLEQMLQQCSHQMQQLPVSVLLLWGVVAVELREADAARATLGQYLAATQGNPAGMSREDAMALSRLYAVQLLAGLCEDFLAAATWLESGGAGLSFEQQELLLLEVEEAEELLQEQHLAAWASTHAAAAAATDAAVEEPMERHTGPGDAHSLAPCAGTASPGSADSGVGEQAGDSPCNGGSGAAGLMDLGPSASGATWESTTEPQQQHQQLQYQQQQQLQYQQQQQQQQEQDARSSFNGSTRQQVQGQQVGPKDPAAAPQQQQGSIVALHQQTGTVVTSTAATTAAWTPEEEPSPAVRQDDNPFCTITGLLETAEDPGSAAAAAAAAAAVEAADGSVVASLGQWRSIDSAVSSRACGRDQSSSANSKAASGATPAAAAASSGGATEAAGFTGSAVGIATSAEQQSWMDWISKSGSKLWSSVAVQGTLHALNLQDLQPYEVVGGAAVAALIGYSVYRERRAIRRAAAGLAAGVVHTAQMGLGFGVVNAMGAVPQTQYLR